MRESWYERNILPFMIDLGCGGKPIRRQRVKVVPRAHGRVLEVGIGSGLNAPYYDRARVSAIVGLDPSGAMRRRAERRIADAGLQVEFIGLSAEKIPQPDASFDSVLITYTLCSIPDPLAALAEMRRVLKPEGQLIFCEHGRAPDDSVRRWQDRLTPLWRRIGGGCHLNRDIPALLADGGFDCGELETMYLPGLRPLTYNFWGTATARRG
jgi:ubiquinone/menaquinone biosynthesis C-methylase UbiE